MPCFGRLPSLVLTLAFAPMPPRALPQNLADSLDVLHKLAVGMDVNVRFNSIHGFEATQVGMKRSMARA